MQAGRLRHRIELQDFVESTDPTGGRTKAWSTIVIRWADILPLRGKERFQAAKVESTTTIKIRMRFFSQINPTWRIKFGDRIFNINGIANVGERNSMLEIDCVEKFGETP